LFCRDWFLGLCSAFTTAAVTRLHALRFNSNIAKMKAFHQMENLSKFVGACASLGVPSSDRY
jgi:hypothetical protein